MPDYVCTAEDFATIESIMHAHGETKFVDIGDALLSKNNLGCLTSDDGFLHDDVSQPLSSLLMSKIVSNFFFDTKIVSNLNAFYVSNCRW